MNAPILRISHLSKIYPNGTRALSDVSMDVREKEFHVIIGLSGSGKSTLLKSINRLVGDFEGEVRYRETSIGALRERELRKVRRKIAMIFQHFNLVPRLSVLENVLLGKLSQTPTFQSWFFHFGAPARREAMEWLDTVGLADKANLRADQLSGGQQQRTAIARALCQNPEILLADEPVASLDPSTSHSIMDLLKKVNRELGITVVTNLHFLSLVREYATRVSALKEGQLVFEGPPSAIDEQWFQTIYGSGARDVEIR